MSTEEKKIIEPELQFCGTLHGHRSWVTSIATEEARGKKDIFLSASRDKKLIVWKITGDQEKFAVPVKSLSGHGHFVSGVDISYNSDFAISSSWDKTLRLWDLNTGTTVSRFLGHTKEVLSVSFSPLNSRQIVSGSADKTIRLWNTVAECKATLVDKGHDDWVTSVQFSPDPKFPLVVSASSDRTVKAWDMGTFGLKATYFGHQGYLNAVTVSPDGTLCASGGQDGATMLWDLTEVKYLYRLETGGIVHALAFSPSRYWLCTASGPVVKIWDLEVKSAIAELVPEIPREGKHSMGLICTSLSWSSDGVYLFVGYSDGRICVWSNPVPISETESKVA